MAQDFATWVTSFLPDWLLSGLDPNFAVISETRAVVEGMARRFTTPRASLPAPPSSQVEPNTGLDVRQYLNQAMTDADLSAAQIAVTNEGTKDERVSNFSALLALDTSTSKLTIDGQGFAATGPFRFTLAVTNVTADILDDNSPAATAVQGLDFGTDVTTYSPLPDLPLDGLLYEWGERFWRTIGTVLGDALADAARQAVKARIISLAPDDALPAIGSERMLEQLANESNAAYAVRLQGAWVTWQAAGTATAIMAALGLYGLITRIYANRIVTTPTTIYNWQPRINDSWWSTFTVLVDQPMPWAPWNFGPGKFFGPPQLFGTTMTQPELDNLRALVNKWRAAHSLGVEFVLVYSGWLFGPDKTFGPLETFSGGQQCHLPIGQSFSYGPFVTFNSDNTFQTVI